MTKKQKTIIITEENNPEVFKKFGKYHIFDKNIIIQQSINELSEHKSITNFVKNNIISRELEKYIKNKKYECLVYLLQGSNAETIKENIRNMCTTSPIKNTMLINIEIVSC